MFFKKKERRGRTRSTYQEIISPLKQVQENTALFVKEQEGLAKRLSAEITLKQSQVAKSQEAQAEAATFLGNLKTIFTVQLHPGHTKPDVKHSTSA
jgi:regulator of replication initiation timing